MRFLIWVALFVTVACSSEAAGPDAACVVPEGIYEGVSMEVSGNCDSDFLKGALGWPPDLINRIACPGRACGDISADGALVDGPDGCTATWELELTGTAEGIEVGTYTLTSDCTTDRSECTHVFRATYERTQTAQFHPICSGQM